VIWVRFDNLRLERIDGCGYDSVSLYDGSRDNSTSLGRFCYGATSTIRSNGSSLFVVFKTDGSINEGHFALNWTFG